MPPKKKVKRNKKSTGSGFRFAGGSNDIQSISTGMKEASQRQRVEDEHTLHYLLQIKLDLSHHLSNDALAFEYLAAFLSSSESGLELELEAKHPTVTKSKAKTKTKASNKRSQQEPPSKLSHLQQVLQDVFLSHSLPTEWDSKEKSALIHAALGVCDILADGGAVGDMTLLSLVMGGNGNGNNKPDGGGDSDEDSSSLLDLLRDIADQAQMIATKSQQLENGGDGTGTGTDGDDFNVATYFLQVQEKIERNLSQMRGISIHTHTGGDTHSHSDSKPSAAKSKSASDTSNNTCDKEEIVYRRELRKLRRVDFVERLGGSLHRFHRSPKHTNAGDSRRLFRELMSYRQSLPVEFSTSIFVRVMDSRFDLIRALIIGPDDTPYANGCFFFDIYIPPSYPHTPPNVLFLTTGGGRMRFNPNLYQCGKVCLSLLGTWQGPGWIPKESTLLQVLVSIQSLIFVEDPFFNEPGYERDRGTARGNSKSEKYNKKIRRGTVLHAMQYYMKRLCSSTRSTSSSTPKEDHANHNHLPPVHGNNGVGVGIGIGDINGTSSSSVSIQPGSGGVGGGGYSEFDDVLRTHFALKANTIRKQIGSWKRKGDIDESVERDVLRMLTEIEEMQQRHQEESLKQPTTTTMTTTSSLACATTTSTSTSRTSNSTKGVIALDGASASTAALPRTAGSTITISHSIKNDVITLDDDVPTISNHIPMSMVDSSDRKQSGGVINLIDSDDEGIVNTVVPEMNNLKNEKRNRSCNADEIIELD